MCRLVNPLPGNHWRFQDPRTGRKCRRRGGRHRTLHQRGRARHGSVRGRIADHFLSGIGGTGGDGEWGLGRWPRAASIEYFMEHAHGDLPAGVLRSVTPAAPDGWLTALGRFGTMTFEQVVQPAIYLLENRPPPLRRAEGPHHHLQKVDRRRAKLSRRPGCRAESGAGPGVSRRDRGADRRVFATDGRPSQNGRYGRVQRPHRTS